MNPGDRVAAHGYEGTLSHLNPDGTCMFVTDEGINVIAYQADCTPATARVLPNKKTR